MKNLRVLVGDDQIGVPGSPSNLNFIDNYSGLPVDFDYETKPDNFIERARRGDYAALLIDLNWNVPEVERDEAGYQVLKAVKDYAPIRILHTGESDEAREKGFAYGATHCIGKGIPPEDLYEIIMGDKQQ